MHHSFMFLLDLPPNGLNTIQCFFQSAKFVLTLCGTRRSDVSVAQGQQAMLPGSVRVYSVHRFPLPSDFYFITAPAVTSFISIT
jgi:hypothetical protein